jgi:hypothetical protein
MDELHARRRCPVLSNRAPSSHRVVIARVQLCNTGAERAAIGISVFRPIAAVSRAALRQEFLICAAFLVTHGGFSY